MKRLLIIATIISVSLSTTAAFGAKEGLTAKTEKNRALQRSKVHGKQRYNLWLQYQFTPGMETYSTITGTFSDPAQTTLHGYQYTLAVGLSKDPGLDWSDLSRVVMTPPSPVNSQSNIASCYTGTDIDPFTNKETRYVDFFCDAGAFLPATPPSGTYTIRAPRSAGTGTHTLRFENVNFQSIDPDLYSVFVPSVKLTRGIDGFITRIDWTWWKKDNTGAWINALDSEIAAAVDAIILEIGSANSTESVSIDASTIKAASGSIVPPAQTFTPARFSFFSFDKARYGYVSHWLETARSISMITPYVNSSDIATINEAFSSDASAPWGFAHNGVDFPPTADLKPFRSASSGIVEEVHLWQNDFSLNWQVNITIRYDSTYSVVYVFEPFSQDPAVGQTQLNNIKVSLGQVLSQGDIIGNLYGAGSGVHVHFGLMKNDTAICPEPYFTSEARTSILDLIHQDHPTWNMCY